MENGNFWTLCEVYHNKDEMYFGSEVDRTKNDGKTSRIISLLGFMDSTILYLFYTEE